MEPFLEDPPDRLVRDFVTVGVFVFIASGLHTACNEERSWRESDGISKRDRMRLASEALVGV